MFNVVQSLYMYIVWLCKYNYSWFSYKHICGNIIFQITVNLAVIASSETKGQLVRRDEVNHAKSAQWMFTRTRERNFCCTDLAWLTASGSPRMVTLLNVAKCYVQFVLHVLVWFYYRWPSEYFSYLYFILWKGMIVRVNNGSEITAASWISLPKWFLVFAMEVVVKVLSLSTIQFLQGKKTW